MEFLILKSLEGTASPQEEEELLQWRQSSVANEQVYREFARLWGALSTMSQPVSSPPPEARALIARARLRASPAMGEQSRRFNRGWLAAAAAVLAVLAVSSSWFWMRGKPQPAFGVEEFVSGAASASTVTLRDGTLIRLAPDSRVRVTGQSSEREVSLSGRAFFAVAHAGGRPFRVVTPAGTVTALGTRFDLQTREEDLSVLLIEGQVVVSTPGRETTLHPGEVARVVDGTSLPVVKVDDRYRAIDWVGNFLAFQSTPLAEAIREIEDRFQVHAELEDSGLATRAVTAWFEDANLDEVLRIVCAATMVDCSREGGVVIIRSQGNPH